MNLYNKKHGQDDINKVLAEIFPNRLIISGEMKINQERYEKLKERLKNSHECKRPKKLNNLVQTKSNNNLKII